MAFEIDHAGVVVDVTVTSVKWTADAALFAGNAGSIRIATPSSTLGAAGPSRGIAAITKRYVGPPLPDDPDARRRVLDAYRVQCRDVEDAINGLLGRDPKMHRPPRLGWEPLIKLLAQHGTIVTEQQLIALPFRFEFSTHARRALDNAQNAS